MITSRLNLSIENCSHPSTYFIILFSLTFMVWSFLYMSWHFIGVKHLPLTKVSQAKSYPRPNIKGLIVLVIARCICVCTKVVILLCALSVRRDLRSWVRDHNTWFAGRAQSSPRGADNRIGQPRAAVCLLSRRGKNQPPGKLSACSRDDNTPVHVRASLRRFRTSPDA